MSTAIEFNNISKQYRLGLVSSGTIRDDLKRWWTMSVRHKEDPFLKIGETNDRSSKGMSDYVWALKDIDFKVEQGDVVGIIGKNGAGKSTLLKILSKITAPTTGTIKAKGRIGSLLEVGTGFHPEMTGRENIYLNGAILGMSKQEIDRKLDEIVDFSGCERYIDTPVKRYSSGMMVRLGFAVAAHLDPEILVVDEVLAVGDAEFQKKAIGKMQDVSRGEGRTVLFVSHNMAAVRNLCNRGIVLENGQYVYDGDTGDAISFYINQGNKLDDKVAIKNHIGFIAPHIQIEDIFFGGQRYSEFTLPSDTKFIEIEVKGRTTIPMVTDVQVFFKKQDQTRLAMFADGHAGGELIRLEPGVFNIIKKIKLPHYLSSGDYLIDINLHLPSVEYQMKAENAVIMHADGMINGFGHKLNVEFDGFLGLESYE